jgi:hypothetical protein
MEPYNPNKSFIRFRLNPDAIKEELISFVPYNRTLRHIYNNPEGDIRETAKVALSETPILGSILAGEPTNAVKEAVLLGSPVKYKELRDIVKGNTPDGRWIDANGKFKDVNNAEYNGWYRMKEETPNNVQFYELEDANKALKYIDDSEQYMSTHSNPYKFDVNSPLVKEATDLMHLEDKIESITNPIDKAKAIKDYEAAKKLYNAKYGDDVYYTNTHDWFKNLMEVEQSYNMKLHKDFYENVNPKQPWPYGE